MSCGCWHTVSVFECIKKLFADIEAVLSTHAPVSHLISVDLEFGRSNILLESTHFSGNPSGILPFGCYILFCATILSDQKRILRVVARLELMVVREITGIFTYKGGRLWRMGVSCVCQQPLHLDLNQAPHIFIAYLVNLIHIVHFAFFSSSYLV